MEIQWLPMSKKEQLGIWYGVSVEAEPGAVETVYETESLDDAVREKEKRGPGYAIDLWEMGADGLPYVVETLDDEEEEAEDCPFHCGMEFVDISCLRTHVALVHGRGKQ